MKKYILIYAYTIYSAEETIFWSEVSTHLNNAGYSLFLLGPILPKETVSFEHGTFTEKLGNVSILKRLFFGLPDKKILDREFIWYGEQNGNIADAYFTQKYKYGHLIKELNPSYSLIANGNHAGELILIDELKKRNSPFAYFERGCIANTWHIDEEGITAGTKTAKKRLEELKEVSLIPFNEYSVSFFESKETWWQQPKTEWSGVELFERFDIHKDKKIILFANQLDNDTSNFLYSPLFKSNIEAFNWLMGILKSLSFDGFVLIKKHPHYKGNSELFLNALKSNNIDGAWVDDISLNDCLKFTDLVCAVNSTMVLDAFMYNKPTMTLGKSIYSNKNIFWEVSTKEDTAIIKSWINGNGIEERKKRFEKFLSYMIENELYFFSKKTVRNNFKGAKEFTRRIIDNAADNRSGRFPKKYVKLQENKSFRLKGLIKRCIKYIQQKF